MAGPVAFVGREPELSRLLGALGGDARLVLIVGDAGVGKTRLVGEGMTRAAAAGMAIARGECLPVAGTLPLLPVASALGGWPGWTAAACWRRRWRPRRGLCGRKWGGWCRNWGKAGGPG